MQAAKRVAVNTGFLYARMGITVFISLYATRLILAALGAKDFGIFNVVGGAIAMLGFLNASMAAATQRFMSYAQGAGKLNQMKQIFNLSTLLHLCIAVLVVFVLEFAGYFFFDGFLNISPERVYAAKLIFHFMIISTFFSVISVPYDAVINARENMFFFALLGILEAVLKLIIAIYITSTVNDKLIAYGILISILSIFLLLLRWVYCLKNYKECKIDFRSKFDQGLMKEMTSYAGWGLLQASTSMLSNYGQGIVINIFFGTIVNAAQGISNQVSGQLGAFSSIMLKALNPVIDKSEGAGDRTSMLKASITGTKVSFFLLILFYIPVLIEMPYIFNVWLKEVPKYAIIFCRLLLIRNLIHQLVVTINSSISAVGNIGKFSIYTSILNSFPLIVSYVLFYFNYPPYSLYIVFIIYSSLTSFYSLFYAGKNIGLQISYFLKEVILKCFYIFGLVFFLSLMPRIYMEEGFIRFMLVSFISTLSFILSVLFIGFSKQERDIIIDLLLGIFSKIGLKPKIYN